MSIKKEAHAIIDQLPDDADWHDLIKALYFEKKLTIGMTDIEVSKEVLTDAEINGIIGRLHSACNQPDDCRNTKTYRPGDPTTLGMVAGVLAIMFVFVFPPITWIAAPVAFIAGIIGVKNKEDKAWVAILLSLVPVIPMIAQLS